MPGKKYEDFCESAPKELQSKHVTGETRLYVTLTCPHCSSNFVDVPVERLETSKASKCLQHLRVCKEYKGVVALAPERKHRDPAIAELMARMQDMENKIASHEAVFDVLVNEYGMFRPITDQNVRPQIKLLIDKSCSSSTALVTASDAERLRQQQETLLMQKDEMIAGQKRMLAQRDAEIDRTQHTISRNELEIARLRAETERLVAENEKLIATSKRIQEERQAIEAKLRSQLKRDRCGTSKSLLSHAEQGHKAHVMKHNLLPK